MQFQVPQFLDVEDKVIGPLTIKQFLYIVGGVGFAYLAWRFIPYVGLLLALGFLSLGGTLAFYKYNNKPFVYIIEAAYNYARNARLYVWHRRERTAEVSMAPDLTNFAPIKSGGVGAPLSGVSKLNELSWTIDVKKEEGDSLPTNKGPQGASLGTPQYASSSSWK
jgi:hypothetical protein